MERIIMPSHLIKSIKIFIDNKKEKTEAYKSIYTNNNFIYVTNGKMAFKIRTENIAGNLKAKTMYKIVNIQRENRFLSSVILEEISFNYPDIEKLFNDFTYKEEDYISLDLSDDIRISESIIKLWNNTKNAYRYSYLEILQIIDNHWKAYNIGQDKPIFLKTKDNQVNVLIMPFKICL